MRRTCARVGRRQHRDERGRKARDERESVRARRARECARATRESACVCDERERESARGAPRPCDDDPRVTALEEEPNHSGQEGAWKREGGSGAAAGRPTTYGLRGSRRAIRSTASDLRSARVCRRWQVFVVRGASFTRDAHRKLNPFPSPLSPTSTTTMATSRPRRRAHANWNDTTQLSRLFHPRPSFRVPATERARGPRAPRRRARSTICRRPPGRGAGAARGRPPTAARRTGRRRPATREDGRACNRATEPATGQEGESDKDDRARREATEQPSPRPVRRASRKKTTPRGASNPARDQSRRRIGRRRRPATRV